MAFFGQQFLDLPGKDRRLDEDPGIRWYVNDVSAPACCEQPMVLNRAEIGLRATGSTFAGPSKKPIYLEFRYIEIYHKTMFKNHRPGYGRRAVRPEDPRDRDRDGRHHRHREHRLGSRRGGRPFDYGELRLLVLAMIGEQPRHGYELMKTIEARMAGSYSPSPGVIYPTLAWLEDVGYALPSIGDGNRKCYRITPAGEAFLTANRFAVDALLARLSDADGGTREDVSDPVIRGMENLKMALRLRMRRGNLDGDAAAAIAKALDTAALEIERSY